MTRPTIKPIRNPRYYYEPFKTQCPGFNTEFSVHDLKRRIANGKELTDDEFVFVYHLQSLGQW